MTDETDRDLKLYAQAQVAEMQEHRFFLSQERGAPVSLEEACFDWIETGHAERFKNTYLSRLEIIEPALRRMNERGTPITAEAVHTLLGDYNAGRHPEPYYSRRRHSAA